MLPLDYVIEKNQINLAHLYQHYENASRFRKMPYTGNHLFRSYGEMVEMCWTGCTWWNNEPRPSVEVCAPGWAGAHAEGWTNQVPEAHSGMAETYLHLQLSLNSGDSGPLYSWLLQIVCL